MCQLHLGSQVKENDNIPLHILMYITTYLQNNCCENKKKLSPRAITREILQLVCAFILFLIIRNLKAKLPINKDHYITPFTLKRF